jgi:hypothetical protein
MATIQKRQQTHLARSSLLFLCAKIAYRRRFGNATSVVHDRLALRIDEAQASRQTRLVADAQKALEDALIAGALAGNTDAKAIRALRKARDNAFLAL